MILIAVVHADATSAAAAKTKAVCYCFLAQPTEEFKTNDLGDLSWLLCCALVSDQEKRTLCHNQCS